MKNKINFNKINDSTNVDCVKVKEFLARREDEETVIS